MEAVKVIKHVRCT